MYNIYIIKLIFVGIYFRISENGGFDFGDFLSQVVGGPLINIYFGDFFSVFFFGDFFSGFFFPIWLFLFEEIGLFLKQISLLCFREKHHFNSGKPGLHNLGNPRFGGPGNLGILHFGKCQFQNNY